MYFHLPWIIYLTTKVIVWCLDVVLEEHPKNLNRLPNFILANTENQIWQAPRVFRGAWITFHVPAHFLNSLPLNPPLSSEAPALTVGALLLFLTIFLPEPRDNNAKLLFTDNTAGIVARRSTFTRKDRTQYLLPVVVTDSGSPALSSTSTLTISVCSCHPAGHCPNGGVEALALSMGVSLQTLLGILVCLVTLTGEEEGASQAVYIYIHSSSSSLSNSW